MLRTLLIGSVISAGGLYVRQRFQRDLDKARALTQGRSLIVETRTGALEYADTVTGPPALMIHGTGGGFDQGLAFAEPLRRKGWRIIAPSRFGYLRSAMPPDASPEIQADAFVDLLDALGIEKLPVIGGSAGAQSAIAFAIRHPDRCSALIALVPAAFAPGRPPVVPPDALSGAIIDYALQSDFLFWLGLQLNEDAMIASLLATDSALLDTASAVEQDRARAILKSILPVSDRSAGLIEDAGRSLNPDAMDLGAITAPVLAISLEDDRFETLAAAQHLADSIPEARLFSFPTGGHVWVGHDADVFSAIDDFLRETGHFNG